MHVPWNTIWLWFQHHICASKQACMLWIPYTPSGGHCEPITLFAFNVTNIPPTAGADSLIAALEKERIPRIIHQTWKTNVYGKQCWIHASIWCLTSTFWCSHAFSFLITCLSTHFPVSPCFGTHLGNLIAYDPFFSTCSGWTSPVNLSLVSTPGFFPLLMATIPYPVCGCY